MSRVLLARSIALHFHGEQRYGTHPYIYHLNCVQDILDDLDLEPDHFLRVVGYLHDVLEETHCKADTLENIFGHVIADTVSLVTDPEITVRAERKEYVNKKLAAVREDSIYYGALIVKAVDRLANVRESKLTNNQYMLDQYRGEQPEFRKAVYRKGLNDVFMDKIEGYLA